ncbi:MAG TPA: Fe2+-dependent dioxygenase [Cellvibrionaceae bacterium]|nr:Fe2+-dependent dioxygenase [Cellvibrionaceae bacterium]HMW73499.1 Fe2+-dependent dioxygenase [Cellvibrionaceae bacterium]HMY40868.1 Fe2+-dependent dioxygenase [Marinagarivorans sp.]HNG60510.1 Fe2+-dependent dioxygenase [Cellvibrionaceae bacterium]
MLIVIEALLSREEVNLARAQLLNASWVDGKVTAGTQSAAVKTNRQLAENSPVAQQLGELILRKLGANPLFLSAAVPDKIFPPLFNRYGVGEGFGLHIDNAIRPIKGTSQAIRTDLSATLFFSDASDYDGGELHIETSYGAQSVKLNAGDLVLYPARSLHRVTQVTRGERLASFFWLQSMVRDDAQRSLLFDLDQSIQAVAQELGANHGEVLRLTGVYHNLLRTWASC